MAEIKVNAWKVQIIESHRCWGSKVDEEKFFDSEQAAKDFVSLYNKTYNNIPDPVPDRYMLAQYCGKV